MARCSGPGGLLQYSLWSCIFNNFCNKQGSSVERIFVNSAEDLRSIPESGRSPGERNGNPLEYSCLESPMKRGAWWATVHGVKKSGSQLSSWAHTYIRHKLNSSKTIETHSFSANLTVLISKNYLPHSQRFESQACLSYSLSSSTEMCVLWYQITYLLKACSAIELRVTPLNLWVPHVWIQQTKDRK